MFNESPKWFLYAPQKPKMIPVPWEPKMIPACFTIAQNDSCSMNAPTHSYFTNAQNNSYPQTLTKLHPTLVRNHQHQQQQQQQQQRWRWQRGHGQVRQCVATAGTTHIPQPLGIPIAGDVIFQTHLFSQRQLFKLTCFTTPTIETHLFSPAV